MPNLWEGYDFLAKQGILDKDLPNCILDNIHPRFKLREYQVQALSRFLHYFHKNQERQYPSHLLFNMATGSGKTLIIAATVLYLFKQGYRDFLFFVHSTNIIDKTRDNFLNHLSSKYLFTDKIVIDSKEVRINEVSNFDNSAPNHINVVFSTVQGLHSRMNTPRENVLTYEDFEDRKIVLISDEAHHIDA